MPEDTSDNSEGGVQDQSDHSSATNSNDSLPEVGFVKGEPAAPWPRLLPRFKDIIGLVLLTGGITTGLFTLCAIRDQVNTAMKQTEAVWYSNRPLLKLDAFDPRKDITPILDTVSLSTGERVTDSTRYFALHFTIRNVGNSPATIDTIHYSSVAAGVVVKDTSIYTNIVVTPTDLIAVVSNLAVVKGLKTLFNINFAYYWEQRSAGPPMYFSKHYSVAYKNGAWSVTIIPSETFDEAVKRVTESRPSGVPLRDSGANQE